MEGRVRLWAEASVNLSLSELSHQGHKRPSESGGNGGKSVFPAFRRPFILLKQGGLFSRQPCRQRFGQAVVRQFFRHHPEAV